MRVSKRPLMYQLLGPRYEPLECLKYQLRTMTSVPGILVKFKKFLELSAVRDILGRGWLP